MKVHGLPDVLPSSWTIVADSDHPIASVVLYPFCKEPPGLVPSDYLHLLVETRDGEENPIRAATQGLRLGVV